MHYQQLSLLLAAANAVAVNSKPLDVRQDDLTSSEVRLYAFGDRKSGIGGFPIIYIDGLAYISSGPPQAANSSAHTVTFNTQTTGELIATVNNNTNTTTTNSTYLLYVPSTSGPVGFTNTSQDTTKLTDKFGMYGEMLYVASDSGEITTKWYAVLSSESSSSAANATLWQLNWNLSAEEVAAGGDGTVAVAVTTSQPIRPMDEE